jgi:hypothetical protein
VARYPGARYQPRWSRRGRRQLQLVPGRYALAFYAADAFVNDQEGDAFVTRADGTGDASQVNSIFPASDRDVYGAVMGPCETGS